MAIITPGIMAHNKYPTVYWGILNGVGQKAITINWSWNKADRDKVIYGSIAIK